MTRAGQVIPILLALALATPLVASAEPPESATTGAVHAFSPEFALGWQWVMAYVHVEDVCDGFCGYGHVPIKLLVNGEARPQGVTPENELVGVATSGWLYYYGAGPHEGEISFYGERAPGVYQVQLAVRGQDLQWRVGDAAPFEWLAPWDNDGDWISDGLEGRLCIDERWNAALEGATGATCIGEDLQLAAGADAVLEMRVVASHGPDDDQDGWPTQLTLAGTQVRPFEYYPVGSLPSLEVAFDMRDGADARPQEHLVRLAGDAPGDRLCMPLPQPIAGGALADADQDGIPSFARMVVGQVCYDRSLPRYLGALEQPHAAGSMQYPADFGDETYDPDVRFPQHVASDSLYAAFARDDDADGVPAGVDIATSQLTIEGPGRLALSTSYERTYWDDDTFDGVPMPIVRLDVDQDDVPDATEPFVCALLDSLATRVDGECSLDLTDYAPPATYVSKFRAPRIDRDSDEDGATDGLEAAACTASWWIFDGTRCDDLDDI